MIPGGELYDLAGEAREPATATDRLRTMCIELIDNTHRLRDLIEEMVAFRSSQEHDKLMQKLDEFQTKIRGGTVLTSPGKEGR